MTSTHPAPIQGLEAIEGAFQLPELPTVTINRTQIEFNGKAWLVVPAAVGARVAPEGIDNPRYAAGAQLPGTLFLPKFFNNDMEKKPKGQLVFHPTLVLEAYLLAVRALVIKAVALNKGPLIIGKAKHQKAFEKLTTDGEKIDFVTALADLDESPLIHFPMRKDERVSGASTVHKISAKLSVFKEGPGKAVPEWGADVATWLEKTPSERVEVPDPVDTHGAKISWAKLRHQKPDNVPLNFTGFIRELGIGASPVNKEAGGKIFFNTFFASSLQIVSYEESSTGLTESVDVSRFFDIPDAKRIKTDQTE
jgi:hypothetical protein